MALQRVQCGRRGGLAPDDIHQTADADDLATIQRQAGALATGEFR